MTLSLPKAGSHILEISLVCLQTSEVEHNVDGLNFKISLFFPHCFEGCMKIITHGVSIGIQKSNFPQGVEAERVVAGGSLCASEVIGEDKDASSKYIISDPIQ